MICCQEWGCTQLLVGKLGHAFLSNMMMPRSLARMQQNDVWCKHVFWAGNSTVLIFIEIRLLFWLLLQICLQKSFVVCDTCKRNYASFDGLFTEMHDKLSPFQHWWKHWHIPSEHGIFTKRKIPTIRDLKTPGKVQDKVMKTGCSVKIAETSIPIAEIRLFQSPRFCPRPSFLMHSWTLRVGLY